MTPTSLLAMTNAEAIVAAAFILAVAAVVMLIVWQLFSLARRGMDQRTDRARPDSHAAGTPTSENRGDNR